MKDYDRVINIMNGNETVHILENMKENLREFDERRESLIEKENEIKNKMAEDGFDEVLKDLGIF